MIVTICSDKHAPGVTTAAVALSVMWPGERVLLEADPSGGDLSLRLHTPDGENLSLDRSVTSLAADAREGVPAGALVRYAQPTSLGFPVLLGPMSAEGFDPMARLWPQVANAAQAWQGAVIADLGRLQLRHASSPVAASSSAVVLLTRGDTAEDLYHVRQRAHELAARLGQGPYGRSPLTVAVVAPPRLASKQVGQVQQALAAQATTSTVPVAGYVAYDESGAARLHDGELTKKLLASPLLKSAEELAQTLTSWFPELAELPAGPAGVQVPPPDTHSDGSPVRYRPMTPIEHYQAQTGWGAPAGPVAGGGPR